MSIEPQRMSMIGDTIGKLWGKRANRNRIGGDLSLKLFSASSCFASTSDGRHCFVCGFESGEFLVWNVLGNTVTKTINHHKKVVSCLALDENLEKQKAVLVCGSYDEKVSVWRVNVPHDGGQISLDLSMVLENQLAAITAVDISLQSGIIVCCSVW